MEVFESRSLPTLLAKGFPFGTLFYGGLDRIKLDAKKPRRLRRGQVISFDLSKAESWKITLRSGQVWITMEGDPTDYVLNPGESRHFQNPGRLVAEALVESEFFCGKI